MSVKRLNQFPSNCFYILPAVVCACKSVCPCRTRMFYWCYEFKYIMVSSVRAWSAFRNGKNVHRSKWKNIKFNSFCQCNFPIVYRVTSSTTIYNIISCIAALLYVIMFFFVQAHKFPQHETELTIIAVHNANFNNYVTTSLNTDLHK